jgi:hypothetical protein
MSSAALFKRMRIPKVNKGKSKKINKESEKATMNKSKGSSDSSVSSLLLLEKSEEQAVEIRKAQSPDIKSRRK